MAVPTRWKATEDEEKQIDESMLALNKWIIATYNSDEFGEYWDYMVKCADALMKKFPESQAEPLRGIVFGYLEGMSAKQTGKDLHWSIEERIKQNGNRGRKQEDSS